MYCATCENQHTWCSFSTLTQGKITHLSAVSAGSLSSGPSFTYLSGDVRTTVDYILADVEATCLMSDCCILPMDDLNTSDHLPLLVDMMYAPCQEEHMEGAVSQRIDWDQARRSEEMVDYVNTVKSHLALLLNTSHESVQDVDQELKYVARVLCDEKTLPLIQPTKPQRWKDDTLTALCAQSRSARRAWKDAGCPSEGPLFEEKGRLRCKEEDQILCC